MSDILIHGMEMPEYIEREALPKKKKRGFFLDDDFNAGWNACLNKIASIPAADVRPVIRGRWEPVVDANEDGSPYQAGIHCSECGHFDMWEFNFCPNCGADMGAKEDE